ncbi:uncharacterized protein LOC129000535 [Macrosteles quadrilineatus]|uniref:uncharacterized protein LOC129000535 n=1 Tax=Macrosteles quadrilineatus TaxID=74068 RepID=UPI0023E1C117|nr:uncharacterized protein LOC129000535 [Macrosteles quadrilineatus]
MVLQAVVEFRAELVKFKKKYDTSHIKNSEPVHIWVIGPVIDAALDLGDLIANKHGYQAISEKSLLEAEAATDSDRGRVVKAILEDNGLVSMSILEDLIIESLLARSPGLKGVVFSDIPRCKCQAKMLKRIVTKLCIHLET